MSPALSPRPAYATVKRVAFELSCHTDTVTRLLRRGEISGMGDGRFLRISTVSVDNYIARHNVVPTTSH